ncbi:MAG: lytic transglycosylase domain-containing protein [Clostridia bacterium]|nr:lytic transglycosylase domain-containing protein [Clostridia bacterium]
MSNNRLKVIISLVIIVIFIGLCQVANKYFQRTVYPRDFNEYVEKYSSEFSVPEYVIYSVIKVESDFDKDAESEKGACGLMQLMPETYQWLTEIKNEKAGDILDPEENIKYGTYYLSMLYEKYQSWTYTFCAYNAGTGNVDKWLKEEPFEIQFLETKYYVNKLEVVTDKYLSLYYR